MLTTRAIRSLMTATIVRPLTRGGNPVLLSNHYRRALCLRKEEKAMQATRKMRPVYCLFVLLTLLSVASIGFTKAQAAVVGEHPLPSWADAPLSQSTPDGCPAVGFAEGTKAFSLGEASAAFQQYAQSKRCSRDSTQCGGCLSAAACENHIVGQECQGTAGKGKCQEVRLCTPGGFTSCCGCVPVP